MADDIVTQLRTVPTSTADNCEVLSLITDDAADEIERLRAAGDALAVHLDAHYGLGAPCPSNIRHALVAWQEARRG